MTARKRNLRRSFRPYYGAIFLFSIVAAAAGLGFVRSRDPGLLHALALVGALFLGNAYFGLRYAIFYDGHGIGRRASGVAPVFVRYGDITSVVIEGGRPAETAFTGRPFRRVSIYTGPSGEGERLDISLKHFRTSDILDLLGEIHRHRADLDLPRL